MRKRAVRRKKTERLAAAKKNKKKRRNNATQTQTTRTAQPELTTRELRHPCSALSVTASNELREIVALIEKEEAVSDVGQRRRGFLVQIITN